MRDVKFRGKRVDNGEWVYGHYGILGEGTDIERHIILESTLSNSSIPSFYFIDVDVLPVTVGQYTGLKDKNGVAIYEGDILESNDGDRGEVEFIGGCFTTRNECIGEYLWREYQNIGNIYENPDLC